jgi:rhodanese-related sulfurtransferase
MRLLGLVAAALLLGTGALAAAKEEEKEPFQRLSVEDVAKRLGSGNVHVIDGNTDKVYREGHIPGAIHLLSKDIQEGVLPPDKDTTLIFYCHSEK